MHGEITKADADALLIEELENDPLANGKFLIRKQGKDNLILSLLHNNVPTHHLIAVDDDGCYSVSGQPTEQTTIASMLVFLSQTDVKWWQTPLRGVVPPQEKVQRRNLAKRHSVRMKSHRQTLIAAEEENESTHSPSGSKREAKKSIKRKTHSKTKLGKSERNELQAHALEICAEWEADATGYEAGDDEYDGGMRDSGVVDEADSELGPYFHRGIDKVLFQPAPRICVQCTYAHTLRRGTCLERVARWCFCTVVSFSCCLSFLTPQFVKCGNAWFRTLPKSAWGRPRGTS
jgi:hypothetical protein